jgi:malate permease and related proteins
LLICSYTFTIFLMSDALQKTITLILLIVLGLILRGKFKNKEQLNGIKEIVLSVALPATIFIALMKIQVDSTLFFIPLAALAFNFFMYYASPVAFGFFGVEKDSSTARTLVMLLPSLAPGLSAFPFIAEFLGEEGLAKAAMADVGNKFFVLIFLYIIAMNMFLKNSVNEEANLSRKIKDLLLSLVKEPINILLVLAITLLSFGVSYKTLPSVVADLFDKTSAMMTPLVLIFIGLAVQLKEGRKRLVMSMLTFRAGITLLFSAALIALFNLSDPTMVLLAVVVPLSSASFWPFAHISVFNLREEAKGMSKERRTFDVELAVLILAFSLPMSTILILGILSTGTMFTHLSTIVTAGVILTALGTVPNLVAKAMFKAAPSEA